MAKSIRISDELYDLALQEAALMQRSLAQQIEHWVKLGVGVERGTDATVEAVRQAALSYRLAVDEAAVRAGRKPPESLHTIPRSLIASTKAVFPRDAFATRRKGW